MKYHVGLDINGIAFVPSFVKIHQEVHRQVELGVYTDRYGLHNTEIYIKKKLYKKLQNHIANN
jgi:hypothetical protein